jgi:Uma2 family endonuclease
MNEMTRINGAPVESQRARITTAQFLRMCDAGVFDDDDWKIELVEGELERMPPPGNRHGLLQIDLLAQLIARFGKQRIRAEIGVQLSDSVLGCDGALLREADARSGMMEASDLLLVIEVSEKTLRRDLGMKRGKYAEAGIPVYWVVDGAHSRVHVHAEPVDGEYTDVRTVRFGEPLAVPGTDATITLS